MRKQYLGSVVLLAAISALPGIQQRSRASVVQQSAASAPTAAPVASAAVSGNAGQTDKQKALADQARRLVDMATDLKTQVAKTNKNILSLEVVRKAEEIEALAHRMKDQARPAAR